jgi:hypothetical protein
MDKQVSIIKARALERWLWLQPILAAVAHTRPRVQHSYSCERFILFCAPVFAGVRTLHA